LRNAGEQLDLFCSPYVLYTLRRIPSINILRGFVMVLMVVDHVRYLYFTNVLLWPEDSQNNTLAFFLTRWITHYCAPLFFFLAGASMYVSDQSRQSNPSDMRGVLWKQGLWLVILEVTVVDFVVHNSLARSSVSILNVQKYPFPLHKC
jgi:uncharacterized membrane protein